MRCDLEKLSLSYAQPLTDRIQQLWVYNLLRALHFSETENYLPMPCSNTIKLQTVPVSDINQDYF